MGALLATAESLVIDRLLSSDAPMTGKSKAGFGLFAFAGLMLLVAVGFFLYAAFLWLDGNYAPEVAAMLAGALTAGVALICGLIAYGVLLYKRHRIRKMRQEIAGTVQTALELADEELSQPVRENPKMAVLVASLAGYIVGEKFM